MKKWISYIAFIILLASCGKADFEPEPKEPLPLNMEQLVGLIGKRYDTLATVFAQSDIVISDSLGHKIATVSVLDKESPSPNFLCELSEENGVINKIAIKAAPGSHGTYKNTFLYFDRLLSPQYQLESFYAIDADGGINRNSKSKEELYSYLQYNISSGAAMEFETADAHILNFFFNEANRAFTISIESNKQ